MLRFAKKKSKKPVFVFIGLGVAGLIGNQVMNSMTDGVAVDKLAFDKVTGKEEIIKQVEQKDVELSLMTAKVIDTEQRLKQEKERVATLVSRGQKDKPRTVLDFDKLQEYPRYIVEAMFRIWERHGGVNDYVPFCIAYYESKFDTTCHATKGEDSRGLFQVNVKDPAHAKRNPNKNKLFDPAYNMSYQFPELVKYEQQGIRKGLSATKLVGYVARYGQRPKWTRAIEQQIEQAYKIFKNAEVK